MQGNDEYKNTMGFKNLQLDRSLCAPESSNLSEEQLLRLLKKVHNNLPPHLKIADKLMITVQASFCPNPEDRVESVQIYATNSPNPMISYQAIIQDNTITLIQAFARPLHQIRKSSLPPYENNQISRKYIVIIIVDDDPSICMIMSRWINSIGDQYILYDFNNGQDALNFYTNTNAICPNFCDFIFMDNQMPILGGLEAAKKIREFNDEHSLKQMPIICITATNLSESDLQLVRINGLCSKPLSQESIVGMLKKYNLTPEQTQRIGDISTDAFLASPASLTRESSEDAKTNTANSTQDSSEESHNNSASSMQESSEDSHNNSAFLIQDNCEDSYHEDPGHKTTFRF